MGTTILQGHDWSDAGDWSGIVPIANDDALISPSLAVAVDAGLDQTTLDLDSIRIHELYMHDVGASGTPLKIATDELEHYGSGGLYYEADAGGAAIATDSVIIQCQNSKVITELGSGVGAKAGDYGRILINRGTVRVLASAMFGAACELIIGKVNSPNDATFSIGSGADTLLALHQNAGTGVTKNAITTAYVMGGTLTHDVAAIATLFIGPGATVNYNHSAATTVVVFSGGTLNLLDNTLEKTITTLTAMPGSTVLYDDFLHTLTTFYDYRRAMP